MSNFEDAISGGLPIDDRVELNGRLCKVVPFKPSHVDELWEFVKECPAVFAYLPWGPFDNVESFRVALTGVSDIPGNFTFSIIRLDNNKVMGTFSYLSIRAPMGVLEIGWIIYSPAMQRSPIGTEAMYLIIKHAFEDLHFRRIEWKCNAENDKSRNAALRYGFRQEGIFRNHMIVKGRNRDSWWASIIDSEWNQLSRGFLAWLDASNFNEEGEQIKSLRSLTCHID